MRARTLGPALFAVALAASAAEAKDLRTAMIRLVPETDWKPQPQAVAVAVENQATHDDAAEFATEFDKWLREAFPRLKYTLDDDAPTRVKVTIEEIDSGNAALRWTVGFGAGKSYIRGVVVVEEGGQEIGRLSFTARPKGISMNGMAKEVAPPLVLKLHNGERDTELHEPNEKPAEESRGAS